MNVLFSSLFNSSWRKFWGENLESPWFKEIPFHVTRVRVDYSIIITHPSRPIYTNFSKKSKSLSSTLHIRHSKGLGGETGRMEQWTVMKRMSVRGERGELGNGGFRFSTVIFHALSTYTTCPIVPHR